MKRLLSLFCIIFAVGNMNPAWSTGDKKPKKPYPTVLVKKAKKVAPKMVKTAPEPASPSISALPDMKEAVTSTKTEVTPPTPWQGIVAEQSPATIVVISPTAPTATPPPANPYLDQASYQIREPILPALGANPFESLKSAALLILPDGIGQMHPPIYLKYIKQTKTSYSTNPEKPILLFQISCPTKALFGVDTPIIYVLQLGVDQVITIANATGILPVELQKVCN